MHSRRGDSRLAVRLGNTQIKGSEPFIFARNIDTRFQTGMINGKTLYYFHNVVFYSYCTSFLITVIILRLPELPA